jgi:hypothetical protein
MAGMIDVVPNKGGGGTSSSSLERTKEGFLRHSLRHKESFAINKKQRTRYTKLSFLQGSRLQRFR